MWSVLSHWRELCNTTSKRSPTSSYFEIRDADKLEHRARLRMRDHIMQSKDKVLDLTNAFPHSA